MFGLVALGLTVVMIYTLVKNALIGIQLSSNDKYLGTVELIIPITAESEFYLEAWKANLSQLQTAGGHVRIHILIDGHHPSVNDWQELNQTLSNVQIHSYLVRPNDRAAVPWMIEQVSSHIQGDVVIIGDSALVPTESAFTSIGRLITDKQKTYFVLPQTLKRNIVGEAIAAMNPTLALTSVFGFRKIRRNFSHPLLSLSEGWMAMPLGTFKEFNWSKVNIASWKEAMAKEWEVENKTYLLAFGEKHLLRYYPQDLREQVNKIKAYWPALWSRTDRTGMWLFVASLFIWSFPLFSIFTHPFWALASILLLCLYRFFTKIVFQESWRAIFLHPVACFVWIGTLVWWGGESLRAKYGSQRPS